MKSISETTAEALADFLQQEPLRPQDLPISRDEAEAYIAGTLPEDRLQAVENLLAQTPAEAEKLRLFQKDFQAYFTPERLREIEAQYRQKLKPHTQKTSPQADARSRTSTASGVRQVRPATEADLDAILTITDQHRLSEKSPEDIIKEGFLVSGYPKKTYLSWIRQLKVITVDGEVRGFILTFKRVDLPQEVADGDQVLLIAGDEDFLLFKQVGIHKDYLHQGLGHDLYKYELSLNKCLSFAPIIMDPLNVNSIRFHEAVDFEMAHTYLGTPDGLKRGIWRWVPES